MLLAACLAAVGFIALRLYPLWPNRHRGCDAYYFLSCAQSLKSQFRLPVTLPPKYLAELAEQWYPPLFMVMLTAIPMRWLERSHWVVNHILDGLSAACLFILLAWIADPIWALVAVLYYAAQSALVREFATLTSRPLGMLIQLGVLLLGYVGTTQNAFEFTLAASVCVALLAYAHKLSLQLLWFLLPFLALATGDTSWVGILAIGYLIAILLWPSYFWKIQRAHWDIVKFWFRHWPRLGTHPVEQSPIYGKETMGYYGSPLIKNPLLFLKTIAQINVMSVFLIVGPIYLSDTSLSSDFLSFTNFLWWWGVGIYVWVALTHFLPFLRCLGLAQQYVKFGYVPILTYAALITSAADHLSLYILGSLLLLLTMRWYVFSAQEMREYQTAHETGKIDEVVDYLAEIDDTRVMIFPYHYADELAYRGNTQVLWGTHGYGFKNVEGFFPVLSRPLSDSLKKFSITHLVLDTRYLMPDALGLSSRGAIYEKGNFLVFDASNLNSS